MAYREVRVMDIDQVIRRWLAGERIRAVARSTGHGLIAKIPHSRRWRLTRHGRIAMTCIDSATRCPVPTSHTKLTA